MTAWRSRTLFRGRSVGLRRGALSAVACTALVVLGSAAAPAAASAAAGPVTPARTSAQASTPLPIGGLAQALSNFFLSPDAVAGANNWRCKPSATHPYPVLLVPATLTNLGTNWVALSPMLANAGYCVFSFNYGMTWLSAGRLDGLGDIAASAHTMATFVDKVLAATGASKVDVVGHSQGGLMPNYYIKFLGGASKVATFVALAPSNHGTTADGLITLATQLNILGFTNAILGIAGPGIAEQEQGSSFETHLFAGGDTVGGPHYVVIETDHDEVVTPYTNAFLKGPDVTDTLIQDQCPADPVGHIGLFIDNVALQDVMNALGPDSPTFKPTCSGYGLPV
jgi:triacylglycerol esterase/lipase EstA (alpha/beta hydrolase family)